MEAEGAADLDLLGDDEVLRDGDVAAEAELDEDAARPQHVEARANRPVVTRGLELHVEAALAGAVGGERLGLARRR